MVLGQMTGVRFRGCADCVCDFLDLGAGDGLEVCRLSISSLAIADI